MFQWVEAGIKETNNETKEQDESKKVAKPLNNSEALQNETKHLNPPEVKLSGTVLRVKRKRNEDSSEMLVVRATKRRRLEDGFAALDLNKIIPASSPTTSKVFRLVKSGVERKKEKRDFKNMNSFLTGEERRENWLSDRRKLREKRLKRLRSSLLDEEEEDSEDEKRSKKKRKFDIIDVIVDGDKVHFADEPTPPLMDCEDAEEDEDYVYDIYHLHDGSFDPNLRQHIPILSLDDNGGCDGWFEESSIDEDDSNHPEYYQNDYPEEQSDDDMFEGNGDGGEEEDEIVNEGWVGFNDDGGEEEDEENDSDYFPTEAENRFFEEEQKKDEPSEFFKFMYGVDDSNYTQDGFANDDMYNRATGGTFFQNYHNYEKDEMEFYANHDYEEADPYAEDYDSDISIINSKIDLIP